MQALLCAYPTWLTLGPIFPKCRGPTDDQRQVPMFEECDFKLSPRTHPV